MTEEVIIEMIRAGGQSRETAARALYDSMAQHFLRFFVYQGVDTEQAKDVLQDTLVKIIRNADSFSGEGSAKSWMWQVARNCLIDQQRKTGALILHENLVSEEQWDHLNEVTADPNIDACQDGQTADECVAAGLEVFGSKEPERSLVLLLQMDGYSIADIGLRIGRTVGATKQYLSECRKKIVPYIEHCAELLLT